MTTIRAPLETDVEYLQPKLAVEDLHKWKVDGRFAGEVWPKADYFGKEMDLSEGNEDYIKVSKVEESAGLTQAMRIQMTEIYGENKLTPPKQKSQLEKFVDQFRGFFSLLLIAGGVLCFIAYAASPAAQENLFLGVVLFAVVTITSIFTFQQEENSAQMMEKFKAMGECKTTVKIGGVERQVDSTLLVPGDIINLRLGSKIPADCRVIKPIGGFAVVEASLTGEPNPIKKVAECSDKPDDPALRQKNIVMSGTDISIGEAWCMVVATGDQNVNGRNYLSMLIARDMKEDSPLKKEIDRFVKIISAIAIFLGVAFFFINVGRSGTVDVNTAVFTIGIIVANVPEGLLATVTVSLALTAARMKDVMVLVKNLEAVETLGSTSVICSDKTGTLTMNKMTAVKAFVGGQMLTTHPIESASWGAHPPSDDPIYVELMKCAILCGNAKFKAPEDVGGAQPWETLPWFEREHLDGDASERALLVFNEQRLQATSNSGVSGSKNDDYDSSVVTDSFLPVDIKTMEMHLPQKPGADHDWTIGEVRENSSRVSSARSIYQPIYKLPFDSKNKWMVHVCDMRKVAKKGEDKFVGWIKGGSDVVFDFCTHTIRGGQVDELTTADRAEFAESNAELASNGLRVFAFAKVAIESLNHLGMDDEIPAPEQYFQEAMMKSDPWAAGDVNEEGKAMEAGTPKPTTVGGKPQVPLIVPSIAASRVEKNGDKHYFVPKVVFLGLIALQDPPRPAVPRAVEVCRQASIGVVMVTGDQPQTAAAIARDIGIITRQGKTEDDVIVQKLLCMLFYCFCVLIEFTNPVGRITFLT